MTPLQARVYASIPELTIGEVSPSYEDIRRHLSLASLSQVHRAVRHLMRLGRVTMTPGTARSLRVIDQGPSRAAMEGWTDAEVRRVTADLHEIGRARGFGRRMAA